MKQNSRLSLLDFHKLEKKIIFLARVHTTILVSKYFSAVCIENLINKQKLLKNPDWLEADTPHGGVEFWDHRKENPVPGWVVAQSSSPPPLRCDSDESQFGPCASTVSLRATHGTTVPVLKKAMWLNHRQPVKVFK